MFNILLHRISNDFDLIWKRFVWFLVFNLLAVVNDTVQNPSLSRQMNFPFRLPVMICTVLFLGYSKYRGKGYFLKNPVEFMTLLLLLTFVSYVGITAMDLVVHKVLGANFPLIVAALVLLGPLVTVTGTIFNIFGIFSILLTFTLGMIFYVEASNEFLFNSLLILIPNGLFSLFITAFFELVEVNSIVLNFVQDKNLDNVFGQEWNDFSLFSKFIISISCGVSKFDPLLGKLRKSLFWDFVFSNSDVEKITFFGTRFSSRALAFSIIGLSIVQLPVDLIFSKGNTTGVVIAIVRFILSSTFAFLIIYLNHILIKSGQNELETRDDQSSDVSMSFNEEKLPAGDLCEISTDDQEQPRTSTDSSNPSKSQITQINEQILSKINTETSFIQNLHDLCQTSISKHFVQFNSQVQTLPGLLILVDLFIIGILTTVMSIFAENISGGGTFLFYSAIFLRINILIKFQAPISQRTSVVVIFFFTILFLVSHIINGTDLSFVVYASLILGIQNMMFYHISFDWQQLYISHHISMSIIDKFSQE